MPSKYWRTNYFILSIATLSLRWAENLKENPQKAELALSVAGCLIAPQPLQRPNEKPCVCVMFSHVLTGADITLKIDITLRHPSLVNCREPSTWEEQQFLHTVPTPDSSLRSQPAPCDLDGFQLPLLPTCYVTLFKGIGSLHVSMI